MKKIVFLVLLILIPLVYADLSKFPSNFLKGDDFNGYIVVGKDGTATDVIGQSQIATKVALFAGKPQMGISVLDSDVDINNNLILIGSPCVNKLTAELLNNPTPCDKDYTAGTATIKYMEKNDFKYIVAAGKTDKANKAAAEYLSRFDRNPLSGTFIEIDVDEVVEQKASSMPPSDIVAPLPDEEEVKDSKVPEDEQTDVEPSQKKQETAQKDVQAKKTEKIIVEDKGFFATIWNWFTGLFK